MNINDIKAGRIYSWVYEGDAKLLKGGRSGVPSNPFNDLTVTRRVVYSGQAASGETWYKAQIALNPDYIPSDRAPQHIATDNPCVVQSVSSGELQVRIMNFEKTKSEYFVDGQLATSAQMAIIRQYKSKRAKSENFVPVMFPYVHNLTNVDNADDLKSLTFTPVFAKAETVAA